ncbi:MAG TPA: hydrogenase maturation protease [Opitutaceae bacterium]|nr:hydrogenase maturation protease [Opitutaceae bacterium]
MIGPAIDSWAAAAAPLENAAPSVLVIGVGNFLMGDEGVGIHVLRALENDAPIDGAALLDGGTGGINLLETIEHAPVVIMIDATRDGQPAGTVTLLRPARVADLPHGLSAHDFGLKDLFAAAALLGRFPEIHLFTISVETIHPMCLELSPEVAAAVPEVVRSVHALAHRLVQR